MTSKFVTKFSVGLTLACGVAFLAYQQSDTTIEDMGEQIALKIIEYLPRKHQQQDQQQRSSSNEPGNVTYDDPAPREEHSKASIFDPAGPYDPKRAMERRLENLRDVCNKYSDFLRPERFLLTISPSIEDFLYNADSGMAFCPVDKVAKKHLTSLFRRIGDHMDYNNGKANAFRANFPRSLSNSRRAIMVRHPMERLISAYRYTFEKTLNAATGEEEGGELSFPEFVELLLVGHIQYAELMQENEIEGESAFMDTGIIDGLGKSSAWNPYWKQCGICNPNFQPHYIMHMNHFKEDLKTLLEVMGNPKNSDAFLNANHEPKSGLRVVEEHYFSQIKKSDIRELYEKFRVDHELFGFTPDYYIALGQDD